MARKRDKSEDKVAIDVVRQHLFDIEPELRTLEGLVAILHALSTTADQVEPIALAPLAHLSGEAVEKILSMWREAMTAFASEARPQ
ncbi:MAG: hypothetical protein E5Y00_12175 [Mesorhizobium sp.]|uniref:hypothetical protein n=1 Tax=unclassified Mesorhizobium TaxID=325217 RepID=UPI000BB0240B|nr:MULTISPECIES: hypothetical protein [unclassified Mesorhizobium]PBB89533.1 hypothetical protein CK215_26780 [Mesorhizobium sp. WSM3864]RWN05752.1 MAG: hypothetical protein EOR87_31655 [Mesorhizobium sp.]RWN07274.1 MAG: hypothetical protein EOR88_30905 [Mesorhizobium sp.]TIO80004.1 MAG: hypothetical protein E5Y00_12175 [Mesorhizobium sp.]